MDFGLLNTTTCLNTSNINNMEKPFKDTNLDDVDFQLCSMPIVDKINDQDSFLSEIPEEVFEHTDE